MKDFKIGMFFKEIDKYFFEYIQDINKKYNLNLNIIEIDDYTKNECDLIIYTLYWHCNFYEEYIKNQSLFKNAKGNPKFLMHNFTEAHNYPQTLEDDDDINLVRNIFNFVPYRSSYKCYGINQYKDTKHNCYIPYCYGNLKNILNNDNIQKNKNVTKTKFCNIITTHETYERKKIFDLLNEYKHIDSISCWKNNIQFNVNRDEHGEIPEDILVDNIMPSYKFNICFENTHSDYEEGYITEKIARAFLSGSVPIYWGNNKQIYDIFNKDAFINLTDVNENKWVDIIKEYDNNDELYNKMLYSNAIINKDIYNQFSIKQEKFIVKILTEEY